jgi:phage tail sheath protein FI
LYQNKVNTITFIPGTGITNYGNKTLAADPSALDRINVSRLIAYVRARLDTIGKQFVFEPNDQATRDQIKGAISSMFNDLVAKRGVYDYLVVCDGSNNTPNTIDQNELYVDIAIEPVKAVEFIYIPVRIKNTGAITSGNVASSLAI